MSVRLTHPNYWVSVMTFSVIDLALGLNFAILHPTFEIFGATNYLWAAVFCAVAVCQAVLLNSCRGLKCLKWLRCVMTFAVGYFAVLGAGTARPFLDGEGSLQLPIMYIGLATLLVPIILEPPANPLTMKLPDSEAPPVGLAANDGADRLLGDPVSSAERRL